jgi:pimeloyl-ACP methyl ester carboxylesterase
MMLTAGISLAGQTTRTEDTTEINGIQMHSEVVGEGEPLLLLHSGTQTTRMWDPFIARFSEHYQVIAADLRGHGGSTNPDGLWTTRQFAEDVFALLDHLKVDQVRAVGASAGAMTLLQMATRQPDRIEALVVIGAGIYIPVECRQILANTTTEGLPETAWERLRAKHPHGDDQIRALYAWVASLADSYEDMVLTPPQLANIPAPTLVVHGDRDYCFPASMAWDIYQAIPNSALWVVPNGGHVPITGNNADRFADIVLEFLATAGSSE